MKDKEIIQALKENEKPFGLMSEDMRVKARDIGNKEFCLYTNSHDEWMRITIYQDDFDDCYAYCLRSNYEELKWPDKVFASTGDTEKDSMNNVIGVTAHCKCGHVFCDDVVHCKQQPKPIVDVRSSVSATEEKPEIVEIPVCCNNNSKYLYYIFEQETPLTQAPDHPDFIGFKYEDGRIRSTARCYSHTTGKYLYMTLEEVDTCKVLTPTHVLFRKG